MWVHKAPSGVPTGVAVFPTDVAIRGFAERAHTIVHWSEFERGGHFAALEAPDLFVGDVPKRQRRSPLRTRGGSASPMA